MTVMKDSIQAAPAVKDLKYAREPKGKIQRGKVIGEGSLKMRTKRPETSNDGWPE